MSQKWIRSKKWDDEHIPRALWPVKFLLRAFSSITLAIILLLGVSLYGAAASVPVGLIALAPTYLVYGVTVVLAIALIAVLPTWAMVRALASIKVGPAGRFVAGFVGMLLLSVGAVWIWHRLVWPSLRYDEVTGHGFRLFKDFVAANKSVTVRRLRGMEMSELEFYGWWPLKTMLLLFVANLVFATVRRIEFTFKNIGVLTVHTGIVVIAVGSIWYSALKEEGDMVLESGQLNASGVPRPGPVETGFYDNTTVALWVSTGRNWEVRPLEGVPRYNDYNLDALGAGSLPDGSKATASEYVLDIPAPAPARGATGVDPNLKFRVVGYAPYADLVTQWVKPGTPAASNGRPKGSATWWVTLTAQALELERRFPFWPTIPAGRALMIPGALGVEFTKGMSQQRWQDLQAVLPDGALHALVLEANGERRVVAAEQGKTINFAGYSITVSQLLPQPPFPIITAGYEGAQSSVAIVVVTDPQGKRFERYVYHRFPEISQDMLPELNERGMPKRRDADPGIRIGYIDASTAQVYLDEVFGSERQEGGPVIRAIMRPRGGQATVTPNLRIGSKLPIGPGIEMTLAERWDDAVEIQAPVPVDPAQRDNKDLGTHRFAAIAVEAQLGEWKQRLWLPFAQYVLKEMNQARVLTLPDGRQVVLAFGRMMRDLPGLELQLKDFVMIPHPFGGPTRDFRSELLVHQVTEDGVRTTEQSTSLNDPLLVRVPFRPRPNVPAVANWIYRAISVIAPTQYKFSQAGWDAQGWEQTEAEVAAGLRKRPSARWTILGVGNNPGIYVIATGAVMMGVGIPWAFYIKPLLVRREKRKIQEKLAREKPRKAADIPEKAEAEEAVAAAGVKS